MKIELTKKVKQKNVPPDEGTWDHLGHSFPKISKTKREKYVKCHHKGTIKKKKKSTEQRS